MAKTGATSSFIKKKMFLMISLCSYMLARVNELMVYYILETSQVSYSISNRII